MCCQRLADVGGKAICLGLLFFFANILLQVDSMNDVNIMCFTIFLHFSVSHSRLKGMETSTVQ